VRQKLGAKTSKIEKEPDASGLGASALNTKGMEVMTETRYQGGSL